MAIHTLGVQTFLVPCWTQSPPRGLKLRCSLLASEVSGTVERGITALYVEVTTSTRTLSHLRSNTQGRLAEEGKMHDLGESTQPYVEGQGMNLKSKTEKG